MTAGERVKYIRTELEHLTLEKFGDRIGIKKSTLSMIENGKSSITDQMAKSICREFGISEDWLRDETGKPVADKTMKESIREFADTLASEPESFRTRLVEGLSLLGPDDWKDIERIFDTISTNRKRSAGIATEVLPTRFISYHQKVASAGNGQIIFEDMPVDRIPIPDIPEYKRVAYAVGVNGHSMEPLFEDGYILLVEPTCSVSVGEIGIFIVGNESFVKKLGDGELISLNKGYGNIPLTEDSKCMGRVVDKIKI